MIASDTGPQPRPVKPKPMRPRVPEPAYIETIVFEVDGQEFAVRVDPDGKPVGQLTPAGQIAWAKYEERRREAAEKEQTSE